MTDMGAMKEACFDAMFDRLIHDQICIVCGEVPADEPYDSESESGGVCAGCLYMEHVMSKDN